MSAYVPPASSTGDSCSGGCGTSNDAKVGYIRNYLNAHMLSWPSHRYEYITWIVLGLICIVLSVCYHVGIQDQSYVGAFWSRWALKNRVIKIGSKQARYAEAYEDPLQKKSPKRRKVLTFPSFGRFLLLSALIIVPVILTLVGADYIRPTANVFDMSESWPNTSVSPFTPGLNRRLEWGLGNFPRVSTNPPKLTLPYRTWWTAGGRTGAMTNALTPFVVIVALKQIPFALFSTRLLGGIAFDRLSFLHKWGGRIVWLFATAHVILWSVQLEQDEAFGTSMWKIIFLWTKFRWGFVSYGFFTMLVLLSVEPFRLVFYEFFYVSHVICVIGFMVTAWLHHPPLGPWMYATLLWWLLERVTRAIKVAYINGIGFAGEKPHATLLNAANNTHRHSQNNTSISAASSTIHGDWKKPKAPNSHLGWMPSLHTPSPGAMEKREDGDFSERRKTRQSAQYDAVNDVIGEYAGLEHGIPMEPIGASRYELQDNGSTFDDWNGGRKTPDSSIFHTSADQYTPTSHNLSRTALIRKENVTFSSSIPCEVAAVLRPGFAYAQLLPGKTLRLTLRTPNNFSWKPGQYVSLNTPSVRCWQSHPFTVASAHIIADKDISVSSAEKGLMPRRSVEGRTMILLLRARGGFTNALWDYVRIERERQIRHIEESTGVQYVHGQVAKTATGVHMRAIVDGPYGSSQRIRWGIHSSIIIICGGSGVSYGMAVLEHLCSTMAGLRQERNFQVQRVRFIWILREFSHLQWIASALRRCIEMVPPEMLQVDLYVTSHHAQHLRKTSQMRTWDGRTAQSQDKLIPPSGSDMMMSNDEAMQLGRFTEGPDQEEYDIDAFALTQFDGEDASAPTAAEAKMNERVHKEGKLRRAHTRRATQKRKRGRGGKALGMSDRRVQSPFDVAREGQQAIYDEANLGPSSMYQKDLGNGDAWSEDEKLSHGARMRSRPAEYDNVRREPSPQQFLGVESSKLRRPGHPASGQSTPLPMSPSPMSSPQLVPTSVGSYGYPAHNSSMERPGSSHASSSNGHTLNAPSYSSLPQLNAYSPQPPGKSGLPHPSHLGRGYINGEELQQTQSAGDAPIDVDETEMADIGVVAELARSGYPKLDRIIREESQRASSRVLVSACGPSSLANLIRSIVSKQIDLSSIRKGQLNAHINVATESYEWGG